MVVVVVVEPQRESHSDSSVHNSLCRSSLLLVSHSYLSRHMGWCTLVRKRPSEVPEKSMIQEFYSFSYTKTSHRIMNNDDNIR